MKVSVIVRLTSVSVIETLLTFNLTHCQLSVVSKFSVEHAANSYITCIRVLIVRSYLTNCEKLNFSESYQFHMA